MILQGLGLGPGLEMEFGPRFEAGLEGGLGLELVTCVLIVVVVVVVVVLLPAAPAVIVKVVVSLLSRCFSRSVK